ncbi:hypothetical protein QYF36_012439 [Acer negundo]|nr:hypothetical protein QYF36_012439 [Acer negundo]
MVANIVVTIKDYEQVTPYNERELLKAVLMQPVATAICTNDEFSHYGGGMYLGSWGLELDHSVTIVGYGIEETGAKYWILKNSWGKRWGDGGYMKIPR